MPVIAAKTPTASSHDELFSARHPMIRSRSSRPSGRLAIAATMNPATIRTTISTMDTSNPKVDSALLIRAAAEVARIDALTPSISDNLKVEYIAVNRVLDDLPGLARTLDAMGSQAFPYDENRRGLRAYWFAKREPERSRRVARLVFTNWLAHCDDPAMTAPVLIGNHKNSPIWGLYDAPPKHATSAIAPASLFAWIESTALLWRFLPMYPYLAPNAARERQGRATLIVYLAEQAYARDHGDRPESAELLVPKYLKALPSEYVGVEPSLR